MTTYPIELKPLSPGDRIKAIRALRRGDVVWINLMPIEGHEQTKLRPCVVISNDIINKNLATILVVPITTHEGTGRVGKHEVAITTPLSDSGLEGPAAATPHFIRSVDPLPRATKIVGRLCAEDIEAIFDTLMWCAGPTTS